MYHSTRKYAVAMLSLAVLSQSIAFGAYTAAAGPSAGTAASAAVSTLEGLGAVSLKSGVSVKLLDASLQPQASGNILTYTLNYHNGSSSNVSLIDYFSKVTTSGGAVIQGKPVTSSAAIKSIPANSSQPVTYYVNAGQGRQNKRSPHLPIRLGLQSGELPEEAGDVYNSGHLLHGNRQRPEQEAGPGRDAGYQQGGKPADC